VQFEFNLKPLERPPRGEFLSVGLRQVPMTLVRNARAKRYVIRLRSDGTARVTIPRWGSAAEARRFAERSKGWLARQFQRLASKPALAKTWLAGTEIFFRGDLVKIEVAAAEGNAEIRFSSEVLKVSSTFGDLRSVIERHLWKVAAEELPPRVVEHAAAHGLRVRRVTVRNQRSRWGSCSRRGTISLNWRLIQTPAFVRDYIILHELMHLRQMNHSARFWREVQSVFPDYASAERWLKQHSSLLS
jgi:predicted metal-dependent hydrolase